jgi:hypothetical protein
MHQQQDDESQQVYLNDTRYYRSRKLLARAGQHDCRSKEHELMGDKRRLIVRQPPNVSAGQ